MPPTQHRYHFPNLLEAFCILLVLYFTEYFMDALIWKFGRDAGLERISIQSIGRVLACGLVFTVLLHHAKRTYRDLFHESTSSWKAALGLFSVPILLLTPGLLLVETLIQIVVVHFFPMSQSMIDMFREMSTGGLGAIVLVCLIAPIVEEMLFRGIILRSFLQQYPSGVAIVHSAAVFGLAHLNVYQFVGAFVTGLLSARARCCHASSFTGSTTRVAPSSPTNTRPMSGLRRLTFRCRGLCLPSSAAARVRGCSTSSSHPVPHQAQSHKPNGPPTASGPLWHGYRRAARNTTANPRRIIPMPIIATNARRWPSTTSSSSAVTTGTR